jgi:uncharacterized membrane protein YeaQ/YmgE (transglycosylase-associated protein family)
MDIIWFLVVGGVIGWLASILMGTNGQMGILANIVVGIVGSYLGSLLAPKLGIFPSDWIGSLLVGVGGAVLLILLLKLLRVFR